MKENYENSAKVIKVVSDAGRLKIIDILFFMERCACDILEHFQFTQPTLSHHMKVLMETGIVKCNRSLWSMS